MPEYSQAKELASLMFNTSLSAAMMEKSLSALWKRNQVTMHNIANEDTPGYKAKRVEFESLLNREMNAMTNVTTFGKRNTIARVNSVEPIVYDDRSTVGRADGNNVDIDAENIELARIQIQYNALAQKITGHYNNLRYAFTGR